MNTTDFHRIREREREMEMEMDFLVTVLGLLFAFTLTQSLLSLATGGSKNRKLPPGPAPFPVIGNLNKLGDLPHQSLAELAKTHGPIMSLKLGQITTVVISSSVAAKEVLQKQDLAFSNRAIPDAAHASNHHQHSVMWLPVASRWRNLRKIMNSNIFSGNRLDANQRLRRTKVEELISYCGRSSQGGDAVDIGRAAFRTSLNLLSNTIFSKDMTDPFQDTVQEFKDLVWNMMVEVGKPNLVDFFPLLKKIDPQGIRRRLTGYFEKTLKVFGGLIDERLDIRRLQKTEKGDVLDVLLNTIEENPEEMDRTQIEHVLLDLFAAATETTSSSVEWGMAELMKNPEAMKKAKAELQQIIGKGKPIEEADVSHLPYLRCIMKETLRLHPAAPFLIPRKPETDVEVWGYTVPKGSQVLVNAWAIGRDSSAWENPLAFMPERFLASEIDVQGQDFELIPFGAGRRICPGMPLAIRMIPVMLGSLINSFDWKLEGDVAPKDLDMKEKYGITVQKALPLRAVPIPIHT